MVEETMKRFGRIDILINNAGALWWKKVVDTDMKRYDLINSINSSKYTASSSFCCPLFHQQHLRLLCFSRFSLLTGATFACTKACLPHMLRQGFGRIVVMSPPISLDVLSGLYFLSD